MTRIGVLVATAVTVTLVAGTPSPAAEARRYATLEERTIAKAIADSPRDYLAARVNIQSSCEIRRDEFCFDRVRILDLIAQAPAPGLQRAPGDDFYLFSGGEPKAPPGPELQVLVFVVPWNGEEEPTVYAARMMHASSDEQAVSSLRKAVESVLKQE
jgi:hypothetical protein